MNTNYENKFYDVTIKELLALTLKQWRRILLIGLIFAFVIGLYKFIPVYKIANNDQLKTTKVIENENEKAQLQESINKKQFETNRKEKELKESIYYNLEPTMITQGVLSFYIDTPIKDEDLGYQNNLVYAYAYYFDSGEIYNNVSTQLSEFISPIYLKQIVKTETNYADKIAFLKIYIWGSNKTQVNEILQLLKKEVYNYQSQVSNIVSEHTIKLVSENTTVVTDTQVKTDKELQEEGLKTLKSELDEKKSQLQSLESNSISKRNALKLGLKFGFVGLFVGIILAMLYYAVIIIFTNKIKSRKQIVNNYGVDVLGEYIREPKNIKKLDIIISKFAYEPYDVSKEEMNLIIAENIIAMSKTKKILIVGCKDIVNIEEIFNGITSSNILKELEMSFSDKLMNNSETLSKVLDSGSIIIIVKKNKTSLDELNDAVHTVNNYQKDFLGVILV